MEVDIIYINLILSFVIIILIFFDFGVNFYGVLLGSLGGVLVEGWLWWWRDHILGVGWLWEKILKSFWFRKKLKSFL